jgi:hypothetical protein
MGGGRFCAGGTTYYFILPCHHTGATGVSNSSDSGRIIRLIFFRFKNMTPNNTTRPATMGLNKFGVHKNIIASLPRYSYWVVGSAMDTSTLSVMVILAAVTVVAMLKSLEANPDPDPISFFSIRSVPMFILDRTQSPPFEKILDNLSNSTFPFTPLAGA